MNDKRNLYFGVIGMVLGITLALIGILYYDYFLHRNFGLLNLVTHSRKN